PASRITWCRGHPSIFPRACGNIDCRGERDRTAPSPLRVTNAPKVAILGSRQKGDNSMRLPSPIVAGSIAIGVFAGGFAVGHFLTDDSGSSAKGKPQVLGQVFAKNPDPSTSTTAATLAPVNTPSTH